MKVHFIGADTGWGAQIRSCEKGPEEFFQYEMFQRLRKQGIDVRDIELLYPEKQAEEEKIPLSQALPLVHEFNLRLADSVRNAVQRGEFPAVVGGDHSIAVGTWNGVFKALSKPLGLLWIDAHMDAHTPETTPSGAWHGMPLAALLGYGDPKMAKLLQKEPILSPENVALIGIRSYEEGEAVLLKRLGVKIYFMEEVRKRGLKEVFLEAKKHVTSNTKHFGVSMDLDVIDPFEAPGVGSPEKEGIASQELFPALAALRDDRCVAFELVEYNPERDFYHKTMDLAFQILKEVLQ